MHSDQALDPGSGSRRGFDTQLNISGKVVSLLTVECSGTGAVNPRFPCAVARMSCNVVHCRLVVSPATANNVDGSMDAIGTANVW